MISKSMKLTLYKCTLWAAKQLERQIPKERLSVFQNRLVENLAYSSVLSQDKVRHIRELVQNAPTTPLIRVFVRHTYRINKENTQPELIDKGFTALKVLGNLSVYLENKKKDKESVKYSIGQVVEHKIHRFKGVIIAYDTKCRQSTEWKQHQGVYLLERGENQPFYSIIIEHSPSITSPSDYFRYVAEENIIPVGGQVNNDLLKQLVEYDPVQGRYIPKNPELKYMFPYD